MKATSLLSIILFTIFVSFKPKENIKPCFLSFKSKNGLSADTPERLPDGVDKTRQIKTLNGEVSISRIDGYRILYINDKKAPFVNLKVELSDHTLYAQDTMSIKENLAYLNSVSEDMESNSLMELSFNGYKIYGLNRNSISKGSTLGIFAMFPGNDIIVYFNFNNLKPEFRNFNNLDEYKAQRNQFLKDYTQHLRTCK